LKFELYIIFLCRESEVAVLRTELIMISFTLIAVLCHIMMISVRTTKPSICQYDSDGYWSIASLREVGRDVGPLSIGKMLYSSNEYLTVHGKNLSYLQNNSVGQINSRAITCHLASGNQMNGKPVPPMAYVADPFLFITPKEARSLGSIGYAQAGILDLLDDPKSSPDALFAFFEMKNSVRMKGEIGGAVSVDKGMTWHSIGRILRSFEHLSYPFILFDSTGGDGLEDGEMILIPQSNPLITRLKGYLGTQRVYTTKPSLFPYGWVHASTPIRGGKFADASPVYYKGRWYVWITEIHHTDHETRYELLLYVVSGRLSEGVWTSHPANPITSDKRYARMGGRPVIHDQQLLRPAQDCSEGYGVGITWMLVTTLTPTQYMETPHHQLFPQNRKPTVALSPGIERLSSPTAQRKTNSNDHHDRSVTVSAPLYRLHHIDAQELSPGEWIALVDGEGWEGVTRRSRDPTLHSSQDATIESIGTHIMLVLALLCTLCYFRNMICYRPLSYFLRAWVYGLKYCKKAVCLIWEPLKASSCYETICIHTIALLHCLLIVMLSFLAAYSLFRGPLSSFGHGNVIGGYYYPNIPRSLYEHEREASVMVPPDAPYSLRRLHVLTAVSSNYYPRVLNLIGALQHFESSVVLTVYDIGLTGEQRQTLVCLHNVRLVDFDFTKYPAHVLQLGNFAWKVLIISEFAERIPDNDALLYMDSGLQPVAPFIEAVRTRLVGYGHISATQTRMRSWQLPQTFPPNVTAVIGSFNFSRGTRFCAGGFQGFVKGSTAYKLILLEARKCALLPDCLPLIPVEDQGLFSALIRRAGFTCERKDEFLLNIFERLLPDPLQPNPSYRVLSRRGRLPMAFKQHVRVNATCNLIATNSIPVVVKLRPLIRDPKKWKQLIHNRIKTWLTLRSSAHIDQMMCIILSYGFIFVFLLFNMILCALLVSNVIRYTLHEFVRFLHQNQHLRTDVMQILLKWSKQFDDVSYLRAKGVRLIVMTMLGVVYSLAMSFLFIQSHYGVFY